MKTFHPVACVEIKILDFYYSNPCSLFEECHDDI